MATRCCSFELVGTLGHARTGVLHLPHGSVPTPAFMPVGTRGTVRGVSAAELAEVGADIVLANTYHLWVRPGHEVVRDLGGIHGMMRWPGPILTDSGGFQVFSMRDRLKVTEAGATIRSPEDGNYRLLSPEIAVEIQETMGVDVAMAFDECLEWPASEADTRASTERTTRWLKRCLDARQHADRTALFGIVQGGMYADQRAEHARLLAGMDLDGYAIGGLSVGEGHEAMLEMTEVAARESPPDRVRYLMGVGRPIDIVRSVGRGVDLFDCVLPTRSARHAHVYTSRGRLNVKNARWTRSTEVLDPACDCHTCTSGYSLGYLRHLAKAEEQLGKRLCSVHNLRFYQRLVGSLRDAIAQGDADRFAAIEALAERATLPL